MVDENLQRLQLYLKETPTHVFSCEYCEIFKNRSFYRTPLMIASIIYGVAMGAQLMPKPSIVFFFIATKKFVFLEFCGS